MTSCTETASHLGGRFAGRRPINAVGAASRALGSMAELEFIRSVAANLLAACLVPTCLYSHSTDHHRRKDVKTDVGTRQGATRSGDSVRWAWSVVRLRSSVVVLLTSCLVSTFAIIGLDVFLLEWIALDAIVEQRETIGSG